MSYGWIPQFPVPSVPVPDDEPIRHAPGEDPLAPAGDQAMLAFLMNSGVDVGALIQQMSGGGQEALPSFELPESSTEGLAGGALPPSAYAPVARPEEAALWAPSEYEPTTELTVPRVRPRGRPQTKMEWIEALMPVILGGIGAAVGGKAGVAGALKGYSDAGQQQLQNAQRQQQIDQQRAVMDANERRYAEMERARKDTNDRLKASAGSVVLDRALKGAAQLNDPEAQSAYIQAHQAELEQFGFDLKSFAPEISKRAQQRYSDWARKALEDAVKVLRDKHPDVDLAPYFSDQPPARVSTDGGSMTLGDLAKIANLDPNLYILSPKELAARRQSNRDLTPDVRVQVDAAVDTFKTTHRRDPNPQEYAKIALQAKKDVGESGRAETTLELAQELAAANTLPPEQAIAFLASKAGLNERQLRLSAEQFARGTELTQMGFGGMIPRQAVMAAAAILYPEENLAKNKSDMHARRALLDQQVKSVSNLEQFEEAARLNLDLALEMRKKVPDSNWGNFINAPIQTLIGKVWGDESVGAANAALNRARAEVRRITDDPFLRGHLTVYGARDAEEILPITSNLKTTMEVMEVMKKDMTNVGGALKRRAQQNKNWMSRPLMGPDGQMHDRQGRVVQVNDDGLQIDVKGNVIDLDDYGRPLRKQPTTVTPTATPPDATTPGATTPAAVPGAPPAAAVAPPSKRFGVQDAKGNKAWFLTEEERDFYKARTGGDAKWTNVNR